MEMARQLLLLDPLSSIFHPRFGSPSAAKIARRRSPEEPISWPTARDRKLHQADARAVVQARQERG